MIKKKVINILEFTVEEDENSLADTDQLDDLGWDSIAMMSFITRVQEGCSIELPLEKVSGCKTVGELAALAEELGN